MKACYKYILHLIAQINTDTLSKYWPPVLSDDVDPVKLC